MSQMFSCLTQPNSVNEHISDKHLVLKISKLLFQPKDSKNLHKRTSAFKNIQAEICSKKYQIHKNTFSLKNDPSFQCSTLVEHWKEGSWGSWCILNLLFFLLFSFNFVQQSCVSARLARFFWTCLSQPYIHQLSPWFSMRLCTNGPHTSCDNYAYLLRMECV